MTLTLKGRCGDKIQATLEYEKTGVYVARVYENYGGADWHQTHESNPAVNRDKAEAAYKRFCNRYVKGV